MDLETKRLIIRPYATADAMALYEAKRDSHAELKMWMDWAQNPPSLESEQGTILMFHAKAVAKEELPLAIFRKDTGALVGSGGFRYKSVDVPSFELGYWQATAQCGHGFMVEAVKAQTAALFGPEWGAQRVMVRCHHLNVRSENVMKTCGFAFEGRLLNARRHVDGVLAHDLIYAHTPESWSKFSLNL
ncbi:MAG: hypothetical protein DI585_01045 [Pseudomonas fluorescens]|nr:MAG: hypothetical protein DI585_01045 [Pseudomonas fluorescens]